MKRVLILDEDPNMCELLKREMLDDGFDVTSENIVAKGMKCLKKDSIDLMILYFKNPEDYGDGFFKWMKSEKIRTPVIIYSGYNDFTCLLKRDYTKHFIMKSWDITPLKNTIHNII